MGRFAGWLAAVVLCGVGCGRVGSQGPSAPQDEPIPYETPIPAASELGADFAMEQEVTMEHPKGENSFHGVLQKEGDRLVLVGLAPHGGRAFVLRQRGRRFSFESYMPRELPFDPKYMMYDIHRVWFLTEAHQARFRRLGERIEVERAGGRIVQKRYTRLDGRGGPIVVEYPGGLAPDAPGRAPPPDRVDFHNGRYGYRATIETLSWQSLEEGAVETAPRSEQPAEQP